MHRSTFVVCLPIESLSLRHKGRVGPATCQLQPFCLWPQPQFPSYDRKEVCYPQPKPNPSYPETHGLFQGYSQDTTLQQKRFSANFLQPVFWLRSWVLPPGWIVFFSQACMTSIAMVSHLPTCFLWFFYQQATRNNRLDYLTFQCYSNWHQR